MNSLSLEILLVEDNATDVLLLRDALDQVPTITFVLTHVERLDAGLKCLDAHTFDAVLLDLGLPDSQGLATLAQMQSLHPGIPIMVLSGLDDENIAVEAVRSGAQDYLVKGSFNGTMIALTIRYAIERKRSEQRLRVAEAGYRRLFETAQDGIFLLDADTGQITDANPSLQILLGYTVAEFLGKRLWEIAPFRDKAANQAAFRTLQDNGFIRYEDLPLAAKDGRFIPVEFVSSVYTVENKRVIQCNIRDITERKASAEAMEAKSREIVTIWESMTDAFFSLDTQWRFTHINPQAALLVQKNREELIGVNIWDAFPQSVNTTVSYKEYHRAMREQIPVRFEDFSQRLGKSFEVHAYPSSTGLAVYFRDVSERKQAETQLVFQKTLLEAQSEASPDGILAVSNDGKILSYNQRYVQMWGVSAEVVASGDNEQFRQTVLNQVVNSEQVLESALYLYAHPDERSHDEVVLLDGRIFDRYSAPIVSATGTYYGRVWYFRDITERKQAEDRIHASEANLARAQQIAHVGSWELDLSNLEDINKNPLRWSDEVFRIFGYQPGQIEVSNETFFRAVHPDDREQIIAAMSQAVRGRKPFSLDHRIVLPGGRERIVYEQAEFVSDTSGKLIKMVGTVRDITEHKQAEKAIPLLPLLTMMSLIVVILFFITDYIQVLLWPNLRGLAANLTGRVPDMLTVSGIFYVILRKQERLFRQSLSAITERKQAEALLMESQQRLTLATESAHIGIWDWDVAAKKMVWDAQMFALYGIRMDDFSGAVSAWEKGLHPEDRDSAEAEIDAALTGDRDFHTQFRVVQPGGEVRHIEAHALVQRAEDGSPLRMTGVNWDITERRQAEESLRRSEERYRSLALTTTQIVWVTNANGLVEDMPTWRNFTGQSIDEVRGDKWAEALHPDDREPTLKIWTRSVETSSFYETEYRIRSANGDYRLFAVRGVPVFERDGSVREWVGTCTDIQDRRTAEEDVDRFFTLSLDMLCIAGLDGYFKRVNPAFMETLGYTEAEILSQPFLERSHPDDAEATMNVVKTLSQANPVIGFENRYHTKDGSWKWLEWRSVAVPEKGLLYAAARDVTQRKESEAALRQLHDELEVRVEERTAELQLEISERERAEGKVRVQARQHEAVAELGQRALLNTDLDTLLKGVVALISATLEVNLCSFWERLPGTNILRMRTGVGLSKGMEKPQDKTIGDNTQIGYTALGTVPVISEKIEHETRFAPALHLLEKDITRLITVPVHDGELHGVLKVGSPDKQEFSHSEVHFLQTVANVLSSAIVRKQAEAENLQLNANLQAVNDELRANEARLLQGNQISTDLMRLRVRTHDELQEALHQITEAASMMLNIERSSVWLFNENGTVIHCHDLYERSHNRHSSGFELVEDGNYFPAIKAQREVVADDARTNPVTSAYCESYLEPNGIASILDVALVVGGKHIGVLCCEHVGTPRQWQAEERTFASAIASVCSLVLESYERARVEVALQASKGEAERARDEANAANRAKSEFLSRMSHELRTPLNAILGFGQILNKQDLAPLSKESVGYILKGGRHLLDLINEVLDIARVEAGHVDLSIEPVDLDDLVVEACAMMWPLATERSIRIEEDTKAHGHENTLHVMADRQRLKQVLINLLSNAIKYNNEGGQVKVTCDQNPNGWIIIAVHDTGPGIAPQDLPKLFMPFQRLSASDSDIEGTGLGLVLSQRLVTAMGGTLVVESVLGHGTTFTIALPGAVSPEARVARLPETARPLNVGREAESTYTVLCIEDNLSNFRLIEVLLQSRPEITLLVAMQGGIGLDMARQHEPDIILLDLNLPDIHGKDVLARLQQSALTRNIPVVVISADATPNQVERLLAAGAKTYLTKPLDVEQFLHTLDTYLQPSLMATLQPTNNEETA